MLKDYYAISKEKTELKDNYSSATTMTTHQSWASWVRTLANSTNKKDVDLLVAKLEVLFSTIEKEAKIEGYNQALDDITNHLLKP